LVTTFARLLGATALGAAGFPLGLVFGLGLLLTLLRLLAAALRLTLTIFLSVLAFGDEVFFLPELEGLFLTFFNGSPASCDQEAFPLI